MNGRRWKGGGSKCDPPSKGLVNAGKWFVDIWLPQKLIFVVLTMKVKSYHIMHMWLPVSVLPNISTVHRVT